MSPTAVYTHPYKSKTVKPAFSALLFDLDHTFYDYHACNKIALAKTLALLSKQGKWKLADVENAVKNARERVHHDLHGQGSSHSRLLYFQKTIESLAGRTIPKLTLQAEKIFWGIFLKNMKLANGSLTLLKQTKKSGIKIAVVTNLTAQIQLQKLEQLKISDYVDFLISSEEAGVEKPDPRIFNLALEKINVNPTEICYIGDEEIADIQGARALDMTTVYLHKDPPNDKETLWIRNFGELRHFLLDK